jgi:2-keto-4-pentenoate hydratase/2-oxohepta-3-ene-1,7-dioic acid hydratase in catechol pathway
MKKARQLDFVDRLNRLCFPTQIVPRMPAWRKLVRFIAAEDGMIHSGEPIEGDHDLGLAIHEGKPVRVRCLQGSALSPRAGLGSRILTVKQLLSPLDPNVIKTVRALGANFTMPVPNFKKSPIPILFYKPTAGISHTEAPIPLHPYARDEQVDYETELCVVIGKRCKDVSETEALDYILGYTIAQDVSSRSLCAKAATWGLGKSMDGASLVARVAAILNRCEGWLPLGPCLVSAEELGDISSLQLKTWVNGELKQDGKASEMLYGVVRPISRPKSSGSHSLQAETISILSQGTTLEPGSVIIMGSPPPLEALEQKPRQWLKDGDLVQAHIPGIGADVLLSQSGAAEACRQDPSSTRC